MTTAFVARSCTERGLRLGWRSRERSKQLLCREASTSNELRHCAASMAAGLGDMALKWIQSA